MTDEQKRYLEILKCQLDAMECSLKVAREIKKANGLKLDFSGIEHEIVLVIEAIEELRKK